MKAFLKRSGFTFAELMIVIAIIAVIGSYSLASFSRISDGKTKSYLESEISQRINEEDENIENGKTQSYRIVFESGSYGYSVEKDFYAKNSNLVLLDFDFLLMSGTLRSVSTGTWSWRVRSYVDNRLLRDYVRSPVAWSSVQLSFSGINLTEASLLSSLWGENLNSFLLVPFTKESVDNSEKIRIKSLSGSYKWLMYQNILGKKEIIYYTNASSGTLDTARVIFDYKDEDIPLTLAK